MNSIKMETASTPKRQLNPIQQFIHKPTNIEHNKKKIVGHIVNAGFSDRTDSNLLINVNENESDSFNIALGAVVYKTVDKEFFNTIEEEALTLLAKCMELFPLVGRSDLANIKLP